MKLLGLGHASCIPLLALSFGRGKLWVAQRSQLTSGCAVGKLGRLLGMDHNTHTANAPNGESTHRHARHTNSIHTHAPNTSFHTRNNKMRPKSCETLQITCTTPKCARKASKRYKSHCIMISQICPTWVLTRDLLKHPVSSPVCSPVSTRDFDSIVKCLCSTVELANA